jgi:membrane-anchored glycerophosphoryl diester phosphodiesterase (GDPDase)
MVCLIAALPVAAVLVPMSLLGWLPASGEVLGRWTQMPIVAGLLAYVVGIWLLLRLSLLLPARAAGDLSLTFKQAWQRSRGNAWRLFWGVLACVVPMLVVVDLVFAGVILIPLGNGVLHPQWAVASAIAVCCWLLAWPVWIGFLSYAYRYFWRPA